MMRKHRILLSVLVDLSSAQELTIILIYYCLERTVTALDAAGNEIMRDVTTYGPSLLRQFGSKAIPWVMRAAGLSGISYEVPKHLVNIAKD